MDEITTIPMIDNPTDFIATELLAEQKHENVRKDNIIHSLIKALVSTVIVAIAIITVIVGVFIWYLNQYDFSGTTSTYNDTAGVYTIIDSEGNVISSNLTQKELAQLMEMTTNGESEITQGSSEETD